MVQRVQVSQLGEFIVCQLQLPDFTEISVNCRVTNGSLYFFTFISTVCVV
jgi:hypothetical protein